MSIEIPQQEIPLSRHLPLEAALRLRRAALTPVKGPTDKARVLAIEEAEAWAKARYPSFFVTTKE